MFTHEMGCTVETKTTGLRGIIVSRSECLYGCNRYFIQPKADKDMKIPDGWWVDEDDIKILKTKRLEGNQKETGAPMSKIL